jgi:hypothetical protein
MSCKVHCHGVHSCNRRINDGIGSSPFGRGAISAPGTDPQVIEVLVRREEERIVVGVASPAHGSSCHARPSPGALVPPWCLARPLTPVTLKKLRFFF